LFVAASLIYFVALQNTCKPDEVVWGIGQGKDAAQKLLGDLKTLMTDLSAVPAGQAPTKDQITKLKTKQR
jgi:hypothetical protein